MSSPVRTCRRTWRRLGVPRDAIIEMSSDLEQDLAEAEADGVPASTIVGDDPSDLAERWARERGLVRPRLRLAGTLAVTLFGAAPGVGFALFVAYGIGDSPTFNYVFGSTHDLDGGYSIPLPDWGFVLGYVLGFAFAVLGALAAATATLHTVRDPAVRRTVRRLAVGLPAAAAITTAVTALVLADSPYDDDPKWSFAIALFFAVAVVVPTVVLARWTAVRRERTVLSASA